MKILISTSARVPTQVRTLKFRNKVQVALFTKELRGQISDGLWENSKPVDHWKVPCGAKVSVATDSKELGPSFMPVRAYNFASSELLEYVGDRMLVIAQSVDKNTDMAQMKRELSDMSKIYNFRLKSAAAPAAPTARTPRTPGASNIKGDDSYNWYKWVGPGATVVARRGLNTAINKGTVFGMRASSNGKSIRLIFKGEPTKVFTLDTVQHALLVKKSAKTK
jgi:hypothetical protein